VKNQGKRRVDELPHQIGQVEFVAHQDVVLAEGIVSADIGLETLVEIEVKREPHVLEAPGTRTADGDVDRSLEFEPPGHPARKERDIGRRRKRVCFEVGDGERHLHVEFSTRTQDGAHVNFRFPAPKQPPNDRRPHPPCQRERSRRDGLGWIGQRQGVSVRRVLRAHFGLQPDRKTGPAGGLSLRRLGVIPLAMDGISQIRFWPLISEAARRHGLDPRLLAAVAAQETGGPSSDSGANIVGDGGHGRGIFQIDDRWHAFARTPAALDPAANAEYAAGMLAGLLRQFGGNVHAALSAYNAGSPAATGTVTEWPDGSRLGYADSVLRHLGRLETRDATLADAMHPEPAQAGLEQLAASSPAAMPAASMPAISMPAVSNPAASMPASIVPSSTMLPPLQVPSTVPPLQPFRSYSSEVQASGATGADTDRRMAGLIDPSAPDGSSDPASSAG
jgi:Transglycosylase SLT domain